MRTALRMSLRELTRTPGQAVGLALLTAIVVLLVAGGLRARGMLEASRDVWYERLAWADLEVRFTPAHGGLEAEAARIPGVAEVEERLLAEGVLSAPDLRPLPALIRVLPASGEARINRHHLLAGRAPRVGERALTIDRSLARSHGLGPGDEVTIRVDQDVRTLPIVGITLSPEHVLFPAHPEYTLPLRGTVAVVAVSAAAVEGIARAERVDSLLVRLTPGADAAAVRAALGERLPVPIVEILDRDGHAGHAFTEQIVATFDIYLPATAAVIVLIALALLALILVRHVDRHRRALGTLLSLGHGPASVTMSLLSLAIVPVGLGALLGGLTHGAFARSIFASYAQTVGYAPMVDPGTGPAVALTAAACLLVAVVACGLPAVALLRTRPSTLLKPRHASQPTGAGPVTRALARLRDLLALPLWAVLGLTHLARRKWGTIASILGLGVAFAAVLSFLLVHLTHRKEIEGAIDRMGLAATVYFEDPVDDASIQALGTAARGRAEPLISRRALLQTGEMPVFRRVLGAAPDTWVKQLRLSAGRRFETSDEQAILIDAWVAHEQGLAVGDTVQCYAYRDAPEGLALEVVGILDGISLGLAVMPLDTARTLFELDGLSTGAHVDSPLAPAALETALWQVPGVECVFSKARAADQVRANFDGSGWVLTLALLLAIGVAVLFLGVLAAMDARERAPDYAVLTALGWRRRAVAGLCLTEVWVRGGLGLALALPLAPVLAGVLLDRIAAANHYRMPLEAPAWVFLVVAGLALALLPLGAIPAIRAAQRATPARALRSL